VAKWKLYIDDSATHGSLVDKSYKPHMITFKGLLPITAAGSIIVRSSREDEIIRDLRFIRRKIRKNLKTDYLPDIHMRLMWGESLPIKDGQRPNPYLLATAQQRFSWARQVLHLLNKHNKMGNLFVFTVSSQIEILQKYILDVLENPELQIERSLIARKFSSKSAYKYYSSIFNPLTGLILQLLIAGNQFAEEKLGRMDVFYDTSGASKGFGLPEMYESARKFGYFRNIDKIEETDKNKHPLIQLADVVSFTANRTALGRYRNVRDPLYYDEGINKLFNGLDASSMIPNLKIDRVKLDRNYAQTQALIVHEYASQALRLIVMTGALNI
jgi:hypothetical protein